jgi:hypothetical protein
MAVPVAMAMMAVTLVSTVAIAVLAVRLHAVLVLDVGDEAVVGTGGVFDHSHAAVRLDQLVRMMHKREKKVEVE